MTDARTQNNNACSSIPLLSLAIWLPILAGVAGARHRRATATRRAARWLALVGAVLGLRW